MSRKGKYDDYYVARYSPGTRIGHWQEEYLISLELHKSIATQLRKNQTFYQENFRKLRKEVESITITASRPRVYNGDLIYILNPHVEIPIDDSNEERAPPGITLSLIYTPEVYELTGQVIPGISLGGTTHPIPTLRNTFRI
uniref:Uncharacterized protein n=2 Tax=Rhodnius prolixus TaxID=13249 RepID=T1HET3_RHOPR